MQLLEFLDVRVGGYVKSVYGLCDKNIYSFEKLLEAKNHSLFMLDTNFENQALKLVDALKKEGDTCGGVIEIRVNGLKSGFGSCMTYEEKLNANLAFAVMSVQAVKGVEFGLGFEYADKSGRNSHDEIEFVNGRYIHSTNNSGGIEGGMSNGEEIVLRAAMKPLPSVKSGLKSVNLKTKNSEISSALRSDVCAVCACEIVLESVTAFTVADAVLKRLGGDTVKDVFERYKLLP
jgi:chorismate synthase